MVDVREEPEEGPPDVVLEVVLVGQGAEDALAALCAKAAHVEHVPPDEVADLGDVDAVFAETVEALLKPGEPVRDSLGARPMVTLAAEELAQGLSLADGGLRAELLLEAVQHVRDAR